MEGSSGKEMSRRYLVGSGGGENTLHALERQHGREEMVVSDIMSHLSYLKSLSRGFYVVIRTQLLVKMGESSKLL